MSIYCWCPNKKTQYVVVLPLTRLGSGRTIAPALKEVETARSIPAQGRLSVPQDTPGAHHNQDFARIRRGKCAPEFGGRAWKEGLPRLKAEPSNRARATTGRTLQGPPPRVRRPFRASSFHAISPCRASIRSTRSNGRSARPSSATKDRKSVV